MVKILKNFVNYSYILYDSDFSDAFIIDPSWDYENIESNLSNLNLKGVLLTHHHFDHVNAASKIAEKWEVPVYISQEEIEYYHFTCTNITPLRNNITLRIGGKNIVPYLTPGHTKGSLCYLFDDNLFTGDTVFIEGCGMCSAKGGDPYEMYKSIEFIKMHFDKDTIVYPGHSFGEIPGKKLSSLLMTNIYFNFNDEKSFVDFRMRKNQRNLFDFK